MLELLVDARLVDAIGQRDGARRVARLGDAPAQMVDRAVRAIVSSQVSRPPRSGSKRSPRCQASRKTCCWTSSAAAALAEHAQQKAEDRAAVQVVEGAQRLGVTARQAARETPLCAISGGHGRAPSCRMRHHQLLRSTSAARLPQPIAVVALVAVSDNVNRPEDLLKRTLWWPRPRCCSLPSHRRPGAHDPLAGGTTTLKLDAGVAKALNGAACASRRLACEVRRAASRSPAERWTSAPRAARSTTPAG